MLSLPEDLCLFLGGGRGGGKTRCAALLILLHLGQYGPAARALWLRRTLTGTRDAQQQVFEVFSEALGPKGFRFNQNAGLFTLAAGGTLELNQLEALSSYGKYQGRSFTLIAPDEVTQWQVPRLLDMLRSNLRAPLGVPTRLILLGNPGEVGHGWASARHALRKPWEEYEEDWLDDSGTSPRRWATINSTFRENPFIDQAAYRRELSAACAGDPALLQAWLEGDWSIVRGAYFSDVLTDAVAIDVDGPRFLEAPQPKPEHWRAQMFRYRCGFPPLQPFLALDYGSSAPAVCFVAARSPGYHGPDGRYYRPDSVLLLDEFHTGIDDDLSQGRGLTIPSLSREIKALAAKWNIPAEGVADDACFARHGHSAGSIAEEFRDCGVRLKPARKGDRVQGWQKMRALLQGAATADRPGLFVARQCRGWWETVPGLQRSKIRIEDVDTTGNDHWADACRYSLSYERYASGVIPWDSAFLQPATA